MKSGQSTLSVGKHLISKDNRFSVAYHDFDHGHSPARWDLHIQRIRFSDAADYQCHCVSKSGQYSTRSTINLIVQGKQRKQDPSLDSNKSKRRSRLFIQREQTDISIV